MRVLAEGELLGDLECFGEFIGGIILTGLKARENLGECCVGLANMGTLRSQLEGSVSIRFL